MSHTNGFRVLAATLLVSLTLIGRAQAQEDYGYTEFEATGSPEAHEVFLTGLLQLHNLLLYLLLFVEFGQVFVVNLVLNFE